MILSCNDFTYESGGARTELDYFVVHRDLMQFNPFVFKVNTQLIPKHSPIVLQFDLDKPMPFISKLVRPTRLPYAVEPNHKIGCKEAPPGYDDFGSLAKDALQSKDLSLLFGTWKARAVPELISTLGCSGQVKAEAYLKEPRFKLVHANTNLKPFPQVGLVGRTWRYVANRLNEYLWYSDNMNPQWAGQNQNLFG